MASFVLMKLLLLSTVSFLLAVAWEPLLYKLLIKYKMGKQIRDAASAPIFSQMHAKKSGTPVMGGLLVWVTTLVMAIVFLMFYKLWPDSFLGKLNFLTKRETLLPLGALVASAVVGMVDDYFNVLRLGPKGGGLSMKHRLLIYSLIAAYGAYWFTYKLEWDVLHVPFMGNFGIGQFWYAVVFFIVIVSTAFSVNETDGLDGLAGGTLLIAFGAYACIAAMQGKYELATLLGVIAGGLLAFLWFNINPAKFFMGDTGAMSLGVTLGVIAMLTNTAFLLPIIGSVFVLESASVIIQTISKKFRGKKVFISSPIHHHFEATGWTEPKIVMRFWVVSLMSAAVGVALYIADKTF